ncbi:MAG: hypothetical protein EXS05_09550 [Planctomycetaceae bacterium]|nr:hypothetical protein [Planctomycetaceae bacterium]
MYDSILGLPLAVSAILATFLGGGGAGIAGGWFLRSTSARRRIAALGKTPTRQFTPGWIFLHLGAFAVVMAFWFWTIGDLRTKIELMRQQQIDRPRRSGRGSD